MPAMSTNQFLLLFLNMYTLLMHFTFLFISPNYNHVFFFAFLTKPSPPFFFFLSHSKTFKSLTIILILPFSNLYLYLIIKKYGVVLGIKEIINGKIYLK